jgi:hypothetical protein
LVAITLSGSFTHDVAEPSALVVGPEVLGDDDFESDPQPPRPASVITARGRIASFPAYRVKSWLCVKVRSLRLSIRLGLCARASLPDLAKFNRMAARRRAPRDSGQAVIFIRSGLSVAKR